MDEDRLWKVRSFVYRHFEETTRPPRVADAASHFAIGQADAAQAYEELHRRHALYLMPGTHDVLMANPFSGVETPFRVRANGKTYFANCAWDSLGIPAALHTDAEIEAVCAQNLEPLRLTVFDGRVGESGALVHFLVPFREWYQDLTFT